MRSQTLCFHHRNMSMFLKCTVLSRVPHSTTASWRALEPASGWRALEPGCWHLLGGVTGPGNCKDPDCQTQPRGPPRGWGARWSWIPIFLWENHLSQNFLLHLPRTKKSSFFMLRKGYSCGVFFSAQSPSSVIKGKHSYVSVLLGHNPRITCRYLSFYYPW